MCAKQRKRRTSDASLDYYLGDKWCEIDVLLGRPLYPMSDEESAIASCRESLPCAECDVDVKNSNETVWSSRMGKGSEVAFLYSLIVTLV